MTYKPYHRSVIEILLRTVVVHAVAIVNYNHLQQVRRVQHTSRMTRVSRLVLFAFMPTLVLAEMILNVCRTLLLFAQIDPSKTSVQEVVREWKRYLCGLGGMHVVSAAAFEHNEDVENPEPDASQPDGDGAPPTTGNEPLIATTTNMGLRRSPRLSKIIDSNDLKQHDQAWNLRAVSHIAILVLPILQAVGTIVLYVRRRNSDIAEFDKRNLMAAISSIGCSASAIAILLCRSQWSLQHLDSVHSINDDYVVRTAFLEIFLASILNEIPFMEMDIMPISWVEQISDLLHFSGIIFVLCLVAVVWFVVWAFDDRIKQQITINWHFVLGIPMVALTIWILADLIAYVIWDIIELSDGGPWWSIWKKDHIANYLPFC